MKKIEFLDKGQLIIILEWYEKIWAFKFDDFIIPLTNITNVSTTRPKTSWKELRAPGTFVPYLIKAGTYYSQEGKKFWYATQDSNYLVIDLKNESYKQIIITFKNGENEYWYEQILNLIN